MVEHSALNSISNMTSLYLTQATCMVVFAMDRATSFMRYVAPQYCTFLYRMLLRLNTIWARGEHVEDATNFEPNEVPDEAAKMGLRLLF